MPGRLYRLWVDDPETFHDLHDKLLKQEAYTRAWILRAQSEAMERDLEASLKGFQARCHAHVCWKIG